MSGILRLRQSVKIGEFQDPALRLREIRQHTFIVNLVSESTAEDSTFLLD
jgi:hypothetical protein